MLNTYGLVGERIASFIRGFSSTEYMRNLLMIVSHRIAAYRNLRMIVCLTGLLPLSFLFVHPKNIGRVLIPNYVPSIAN